MNNKGVILSFTAYAIWGLAPLYWSLLGRYEAMFTLAARIIWAAVFLLALLLMQKKAAQLVAVLRDKGKMRWLIPSTLLIAFNWGLYIWAMANSHVLDTSMGYYFCPLVVSFCGVIIFHERLSRLQGIAFMLALLGVILATAEIGHLPYISLLLALSFALYGVVKKFAHVDSVVSTALESLLLAPFSLLFVTFMANGAGGLAEVTDLWQVLLLAGAGLVSATPLCLYSYGVNELSLVSLGFIQYISPTLGLICALVLGETLTIARLCCFGLIWLALAIFSYDLVKTERRRALTK